MIVMLLNSGIKPGMTNRSMEQIEISEIVIMIIKY